MGRERRKWTAGEDSLLREAVTNANQESRPLLWREIAKSVPNRTNKDCRRRWCNTVANGTIKGSWTESEDERLSTAMREYGPKWTRVAAAVRTRNSDQCSSHWSQSLNPDINYSDFTRDEDERLLHAVRRCGTNWTMIVSTHIPTRTTLALKNRYSALCTKTHRLKTHSGNKSRPNTRFSTFSSKGYSDQPNSSVSESGAMSGLETDDQTNEDDEDEDESLEDFNDEDNAMEAGSFLDKDCQEVLPPSKAIRPRQTSSTRTLDRSSPSFLLDQGDAQHPFNPSLATIENWNEEVHDPAIYSGAFPYSFFPSKTPGVNSQVSLLPDIGTDGAVSSLSFHQGQHAYSLGGPQPLAGHDTNTDPIVDIFADSINYTAGKEMTDAPAFGNKSPPPSRPSAPSEFATQRRQGQGHNSPIRFRSRIDHSAPAPQDCSPFANPEVPQEPKAPSASRLTPPSTSRSNPGDNLRHVSIEATCTAEQLGNLMSTVAGLAKSVTVKVKA